tara:strand:+ start:3337 stop:4293 length:957 start_codon:yes stop_codon:yes gene_type:complete
MHTPQPDFIAPGRRTQVQDAERLSERISSWQGAPPAPQHSATQPGEGHSPALCNGLPELPAAALSAAGLRHGIQTHGAVIVRDLIPATLHPVLRELIDRVIAASANPRGKHDCYFDPPDILRQKMPGGELGRSRAFHRDSGSAMCAEAPCVAESLLELYESLGLKTLCTDYLGEAPCLSVKKWVLRKTLLPVHQAGWHQDGAFMGEHINSINLWIPLTRCGGETGAPGMDVVPARLRHIVSADGALFDWSVSPESVSSHFPRTPPVAPVFNPGDALLFDHLFLHRTQYRTDFQRPRYAIETWFFGESAAPLNQVPIRW